MQKLKTSQHIVYGAMELNRIIKHIITVSYIILAVLLAAIAFRNFISDLLVASTIAVIVFMVVIIAGYFITEKLLKFD
jgi:hypothetical protein